ncbi:hypothetical protein [Paucibacter sp. DJ2R-2]|uniref:hypothetical protein n=1 Tax=Paucibacter sp. DJ2R-2 TaxID=2893558 RepID=UPI0021E36DAE|nr:hypothetical protein [Paucibacter sp. DJ2R-2]MCV2422694.1 hypothetical protein [Paucibacter sp. DJ4R-1]MCV2441145.1 hypothetical protein [Paucibacter sp. DJ2R-2]
MKNCSLIRALAHMALAVLAASPIAAHAVDGVVLIDAARVNAAGGFPYRISQSGSYRLASNLNVGLFSPVNAIEVGAVGVNLSVTIDFNGFTVVGSPVCDFNAQGDVMCNAPGAGSGVYVQANAAVTVVNGTVRGMGNQGIACMGSCRVENMTLANNGGYAVSMGKGGVLKHSTVLLNRFGVAATGALLQGNVLQFNQGNAINASTSNVLGNVVSGNGGFGLAGSSNGYANNLFSLNNGGNASPQVSSGNVQTGGNVCGTGSCQ